VSGWGTGSPIGLIQVASASIGSGGSKVLVPASANIKGVRLISLSIASGACENDNGPIANSFLVEDTVTDSAGNQYLATEVGLTPFGKQFSMGIAQDMAGIVIPAGASLSVNNGGAGGTNALRRCSATAVYSILQ
jgi:hypothetical protein